MDRSLVARRALGPRHLAGLNREGEGACFAGGREGDGDTRLAVSIDLRRDGADVGVDESGLQSHGKPEVGFQPRAPCADRRNPNAATLPARDEFAGRETVRAGPVIGNVGDVRRQGTSPTVAAPR